MSSCLSSNAFGRKSFSFFFLIYGIGLVISKTEAENAIKVAEEFLRTIKKIIQENRGQL